MTKHKRSDSALGELLISVVEIRRRPGSRLELNQSLTAHGLEIGDASIPEGTQILFQGELESIHEGVVLTGAAVVPWQSHCRRCLEDVSGETRVELREVYEVHPTEGETWQLDHDHVDLAPVLHDLALLALPLTALCSEDCLGPSPDDFPAVPTASGNASNSDDDTQESRDPRWAALDDLEL